MYSIFLADQDFRAMVKISAIHSTFIFTFMRKVLNFLYPVGLLKLARRSILPSQCIHLSPNWPIQFNLWGQVSVYSTWDIYLCSDDALIMMEKTKDVEGKGKRVRRWSLWPRVLHQLMASKCTSFRTKLSTPLVSCSAQCCLLTKLCPVTTNDGLLIQLNDRSRGRYANKCLFSGIIREEADDRALATTKFGGS